MIEFITGSLLTLISLFLGYFLGKGKLNKEGLSEVKKTIAKAIQKDSRVGAIRQPTARDIYLKANPEIKQGMEEMAKDLKKQGI